MKIEEIETLAKRRGFFFQSSEIYGGISGLYDYGPVGTRLKKNLEALWREYFLSLDDNLFEIESAEIMPEKVFEASGHKSNFVDPVAKCKKCGALHRADHIVEDFLKESFEGMTPVELAELIKNHKIRCPKCKGELQEVSILNMMFPIYIGDIEIGKSGYMAVTMSEEEMKYFTGSKTYLRPETAQGCYVNFSRMFELLRKRLPLGLAIIGKAYRNEISPRQLTIRMREFTQAELQIFFDPSKIGEHERWAEEKDYKLVLFPASDRKEAKELSCEEAEKKFGLPKFYVYHMAKVQRFFLEKLGISKDKFRFKELSDEEKAFYNKIHWDIELNLGSIGWKEVGGVHYRADHDLKSHEKVSKKSQQILFDGKTFIPHVLELSFGVDRIVFSLIDLLYERGGDRAVLKLPAKLSPFLAAVFPLVNKDGIGEKAKEVYEMLKPLQVFFDDSGSIGRRYYRQDEVGTRWGVTIDYDSLKNNDCTVRDRDTQKQVRVKILELKSFLLKSNNY